MARRELTRHGSVECVEEGEQIRFTGLGPYTVAPACAEGARGHWVCLIHNKGFENQMGKDLHVGRGDHRLAWICHQHGPEVP